MMRKLSLRCSAPPSTSPPGAIVGGVSTLSPQVTPPTTPARRLVSSRSLGSTSSPPLTPPVPTQYHIPPCLPSHQHHARLPPTPGPPSHRSLPALHPSHPQQHDDPHGHHSSHPTLSAGGALHPYPHHTEGGHSAPPQLHGSHPVLVGSHCAPHSSSPPTTRPSHSVHFPYPPCTPPVPIGSKVESRQLPGLPRHHTIGGVGSGRILPSAPTSPLPPGVHPNLPPTDDTSMSGLAVKPPHVLHADNYKYSLDVPRGGPGGTFRDLRSNTYPPPGAEVSPPSQSSHSGSTSGPSSGGSQMSPTDPLPPLSPRLSPGGRVSPLVISGTSPRPPMSPGGPRTSLPSSCTTSPIPPRVSPVPPHRSPGPPCSSHTSPNHCCNRTSPTHVIASRGSPTTMSPSTSVSRRSSIASLEPPLSPLLRKTSRPPLQRSHATAG